MEVDSVVTPKSHHIELEVVSSTRNIFDIIDLSSDGNGSRLVLTPTLTWVSLHFDDVTNLTLFGVIVKDNNKVFVVGTNMDAEALISIWPKSIAIPTIIYQVLPSHLKM
jgi:hypothetical protein